MIEKIDQRIKDWIIDVSGIQDVRLDAPSDIGNTESVGLYLLSIQRVPLARGTARTPLQILLHYLITTWGDSSESVHRTLGLLVFAAMSHEEFEVETESVSSDLWLAFGVAPRPAFLLTVPLRKEMPELTVPYVREPIVVQQTPLQRLNGVLVGEGDYPLVGARIEIPEFHLSTYTDRFGKFQFSSVPLTTNKKKLRVYAKGKVLSVTASKSWCEKEPLTISFNMMEV